MAHILDELDASLIALLQKNGRLSHVEIARSLGVAEGTIRKRLDRLLAAGVMRIMAVTDPAKLGLPTSVFVGIQVELGQLTEVARRLTALPEVRSVAIVTGTFDLMIEAVLPSNERLLAFLIDRVSAIPGVKRTETSHVIEIVKHACDWSVADLSGSRDVPPPQSASPADRILPGTIVVPD